MLIESELAARRSNLFPLRDLPFNLAMSGLVRQLLLGSSSEALRGFSGRNRPRARCTVSNCGADPN